MNYNNYNKLKYYAKKYKSRLKYYEKKEFNKINAPRLNSKKRKTLKYNNETYHRATKIKVYNNDNNNVKLSIIGFERINIII